MCQAPSSVPGMAGHRITWPARIAADQPGQGWSRCAMASISCIDDGGRNCFLTAVLPHPSASV